MGTSPSEKLDGKPEPLACWPYMCAWISGALLAMCTFAQLGVLSLEGLRLETEAFGLERHAHLLLEYILASQHGDFSTIDATC